MKKLIKRSIVAAEHKKYVELHLRRNMVSLIIHLIKLLLYPESQEVNHWRKEVSNFLYEVPLLKVNNKLPSKEFILENTWEVYSDSIPNYVKFVTKSISEEPKVVDNDNIYDTLNNYFHRLANELSVNQIVTRKDIINKLKELGM